MQATQSLPADIRHLILDRDGVLNREAPDHGYILRAEDFVWLPGSLQALSMLTRIGMRISVATNQSAVGRGLMTPQQLDQVLATMVDQAKAAGARIDAVFFCPHAPEANCECRKPKPGLIRSAVQAAGIPAAQTLMVGDAVRDVEAARASGVRAALVRTGKGSRALAQLLEADAPLPVFDDLAQIARSFADRITNTDTADRPIHE
jgi:D-glycero-D-manno-heptose 1,7-bisphosphate phosphatase